ncbi:HAD-IA family hydrolase [Streptomyces sp. NPDC002586]
MNTPLVPPLARTKLPDLEAVLLDYNGVIGLQPHDEDWHRLATLAGWPEGETEAFQTAFWKRRTAYDAGTITTSMFWSGLLRDGRTAPPGSALLDALRETDTAMWIRTDSEVLGVLRVAQKTAGVPMLLLSNAPRPLADALDGTEWCATLMSRALYSARLGVNKPAARAYQAALAAAHWPAPERTLFIDNLFENCHAAARLGLRTLHYTGDPDEIARHLIPRRSTTVGPAGSGTAATSTALAD